MRNTVLLFALLLLILGGAFLYLVLAERPEGGAKAVFERGARPHFNHATSFKGPFASPQDVTRACLSCHPQAAAEVMQTAHWQWLGAETQIPGHGNTPQRIGKKNLINNFCISITGNWPSCTKCHAGYGWADERFDFKKAENVDCLVCHERAGTYVKGDSGLPAKGVDLLAAAKSVGFPKRENCAVCHNYGGGGQGVKHGDLDSSLDNPQATDDVHMGRLGFLCIDCHKSERHAIRGRAFSVSVEDAGGVSCRDCHQAPPHKDPRLNTHLKSLACQTCHIPSFARKLPTKTNWDWSKAGDATRKDDVHTYLKIKGEFVYGHDVVPEYFWFNGHMERYLAGDRIDPAKPTDINRPIGDKNDKTALIWPFKVHRAKQHYDTKEKILLTPITGGTGGFWHDFDWDKALRLGAKANGLPYSGEFGFTETEMFWPLSHMVTPKEQALGCTDCHGAATRFDWRTLGYDGDPAQLGGRP